MTKASDNEFPSVLFTEQGSAPTTPSTGHWRVYAKSDGLYVVDDAGTETGPFVDTGGGGGQGVSFVELYPPTADWTATTGTWQITASPWTDMGVQPPHQGYGYYNTSTAQDDALSIDLFMEAGTYAVTFFARKSSNTGIITVNLDGVSQGTVDTYAASPAYLSSGLTGISVSAGKRTWQFKAASKNASSSGYLLEFFAIVIRRTA